MTREQFDRMYPDAIECPYCGARIHTPWIILPCYVKKEYILNLNTPCCRRWARIFYDNIGKPKRMEGMSANAQENADRYNGRK